MEYKEIDVYSKTLIIYDIRYNTNNLRFIINISFLLFSKINNYKFAMIYKRLK